MAALQKNAAGDSPPVSSRVVEPSRPAVINAPEIRPYKNPIRYWVWGCFWISSVFAIIFAILCALVYQGFKDVIHKLGSGQAPPLCPLMPVDAWQSLIWGAAISAIFAFIITIGFHVITLLLLLLSFKSLGHPGRRFARGFVSAAAIWTALHILNIALQFRSFDPLMSSFNGNGFNAGFNIPLLHACVAFGIISTILYVIYAVLALLWREHPGLLQVHSQPTSEV